MYHLDTALFPVSDNLIAYIEDAFDEHGKQAIQALGCELLKVDLEDVR